LLTGATAPATWFIVNEVLIVTVLEVAGLPVAQVAFEVMIQLTVLLFDGE
jgi:hypothetical protein